MLKIVWDLTDKFQTSEMLVFKVARNVVEEEIICILDRKIPVFCCRFFGKEMTSLKLDKCKNRRPDWFLNLLLIPN